MAARTGCLYAAPFCVKTVISRFAHTALGVVCIISAAPGKPQVESALFSPPLLVLTPSPQVPLDTWRPHGPRAATQRHSPLPPSPAGGFDSEVGRSPRICPEPPCCLFPPLGLAGSPARCLHHPVSIQPGRRQLQFGAELCPVALR